MLRSLGIWRSLVLQSKAQIVVGLVQITITTRVTKYEVTMAMIGTETPTEFHSNIAAREVLQPE